MENPPPFKHTAAVRCHDVRESVCDGIRVDDERQHQRIREGGSQRGSVGTCMFLVQGLYLSLSLMMA